MKHELYELTNPQKPIWLTEQYFTDTAVNTICGYTFITDAVNLELLKKAIYEMVKSNDGMRLKLNSNNDTAMQYVGDFEPFYMPTVELHSKEDIEKKALEMANTPFIKPNEFLFQFLLFKLPDNSGGFIVNVHHLIGDSWSLGLIAKEVTTIYSELLTNTYEEKKYPSYLGYIDAEKNYKNSEKYSKDKAYWEEVFTTIPEIASLNTSKEAKNEISCKGNRKKFTLSDQCMADIKAFCDNNKISVYNFFMAVYSLYVSRISHLDDFVMGTPILNRTNFDQKHTMGMFISVAPLRVQIAQNQSFIDFAKKVATDTMTLFRHQKYSYQNILEDVRKREASVPNLYNVILSYQITKTTEESNHVHYCTDWVFNGYSADELQIHLFDLNDEALTVAYDYKSDLFTCQEIANLHSRILTIIEQILANEAILLNELEIVTPEEKHQILYDFNNTFVDYPRDKTIVDLFEEQVNQTPDATAVVFENQKLTYRELNERANQLARYLISNGVKPHHIVGLRMDKSLEMIIGILAIIKAGACYLPMNMAYPEDRVSYMLEDSSSHLLLSSKRLNNTPYCVNCINIDLDNLDIYSGDCSNLNIKISPEDLIYIIYTSGSTGKPKGAMLCHRNVVRLMKNDHFLFDFSENDVWTMFHSVAFDFSVWEIYGALLYGGKLVLVPDDIAKDPKLFLQLLRKEKVTVLNQTPSYFYNLQRAEIDINDNDLSIRYIIFGGEALTPSLLQDWNRKYPNTNLINMYGITETTVHVTFKHLFSEDLKHSSSNIGKPIPTLHVLILDKNQNLLPFGVEGEICVIGDGVFKGYLNRPELNKQKLISISKYSNGLIYRSGDSAIMHENGDLEYIGRIDTQIKVRGFRVEIGEIENKILKYSNISKCIVCKKTDTNGREVLCAYYIQDGPVTIATLKNRLSKDLPYYMIPQYFIKIDTIPLNFNGKTDFNALPLPSSLVEDIMVEPKTDLEKIVYSTYSSVMGISNFSMNSSFYDLGGDSLTAISISTKLSAKFNKNVSVKDVLENPILSDMTNFLENMDYNNNENLTIKPIKPQKFYPASSAQKRIYYATSVDSNSVLYNIAGGIIVDKILDVTLLQNCFQTLINRHEVLRTYFDIIDNDIVQIIDDKTNFALSFDSNVQEDLNKVYSDFVKPFDLSKAPLFRAKVTPLKDNKMLLLLDMHHIISDGTSLSILLQELCNLYNGKTLPEKQVDYKDFTLWEKEQFQAEDFKKSKDFWVNQFKDEIPLLNIPTTYSRPSVQCFEGSNYYAKLSKDIFAKINEVSKKIGVTPYMLMLSVYYILLSKYTSQDDIVVGTPIIGRELAELSNMLGMFVNTLALRNKVNHSDSFSEFAKSIKEYCLTAFQNQAYPFDALVNELNIKRDTSRNPLIDVMFAYQNNGYPTIDFKDIHAEYYIPDSNVSKFDLTLEVIPINDELSLRFEYCTKLFDETFIKRLSSHYINILNAILNNSDVKIANIDMLSKEEKHQILYDFNNTKVDYPSDKTIVDLFEEQVEKNPDNIAVVFENQKLTYKELNEKANQLANVLISKDINSGDIVGIYLTRSLEFIISVFGVLKAGAAYMPMFTGYPVDRLTYMLDNSNSKLLITTSKLSNNINNGIEKILIDDAHNYLIADKHYTPLINNITSNSLAYVIYTSGSTGKPKGVKICHRNLINFVYSFNKYYHNVTSSDNFLASTNISFDVSVWEIFMPLLNGAKLTLNTEEIISDINLYCENIIENKITALYIPPNILNEVYFILSQYKNIYIGKLLVGVEPIKKSTLNKYYNLNQNLIIINGYGPTETTICATALSYTKDVTNDEFVSIGKPLFNNQIYIVNSENNICPIGIPGELCIAGEGVGKGYLNNEFETDKLFVENPFGSNNPILYKTGDLAKWNSDGTITFIGRIDNQIKLSGYRIELNEINSCITQYNHIESAFTTLLKNNNKNFIVSYFVSKNKIDNKELANYLHSKLPFYMLPNLLMQVESFPLTPNGKIDAKKLPIPIFNNANSYVAPESKMEKLLAKILEDLLGIDKISIADNLFDLGMDSLTSIKLSVKVLDELKISIAVKDIFDHPTIKDLSDYITTLSKNSSKATIKKAKESNYYPTSSAQKRIYYANSMDNDSVLYNIAGGIVVDKTLDVNLLKECFQTLIDRHEVLRTHFDIIDNDIVQIIDNKIDFTLSVNTETIDNLDKIYTNFVKPFDLSKAPLFRAKVAPLKDNKMLLLLDMHHIISDGTSLSILLQELCDLYNGKTLSEKQVDYKDYTLWEKERFEKEEFKQLKDFWVNQFKDEIPLLNMPTAYPRPSVQSFEGSNYHTKLPKDVFERVNEVSKKLGITPYMLMLSAYYILLSKYTSQDDIVVGTPIVGRELPELSDMLGMFVNTLALRNKVNNSASFGEFSSSIKEYCLTVFNHQSYPFDELVNELNIKRDTSRNPLVDVMFVYQNDGYPTIDFKDVHAKYYIPDSNVSKFDLTLEVIPINDELSLRFEYCTKLFDEAFIRRLSSHYINILNAILENSDIKIADIDMLSEDEKHQILYDFNDTKVDYPCDKTIVDLFEEQVEKTPDNIAVFFEDQKLTYRELNEKANQLARYLVENGINVNDIVCLLLDKSLESLVAIIATLKVGASYLPIDVNYPSDRVDYIIKDSKSKILLTTKEYIHKSNSTIRAICVELDTFIYSQYDSKNIAFKNILPDSLAYIMYTSGSTGNPKGVMVKHINIVRLVKNNKFIEFNKNERILQTGSIVFDACTFEIFGALLNGFELYIIKKEKLLDSSLLQDYLIKNKITILWLTAPLFNQLCEENPHMFHTVKTLLTGGDVLSPRHINMVRAANPNLTIINGYGPTENTTFSCCFTIDKKYTKSIPIGGPISNSKAYVVSHLGKLCPIGVPGELWVGGDGVAKGYLNNDVLTNEKFIQNSFGEGILYKTGDLVKWLPNGTIDFIGRIDSQVKIRGFRVELGEITSKISAFPSIKECVTVVNNIRGEKTICSYIVSDKQIDIQELKQYLKRNLPVYMIPTYFMQLEKLPINTNGKVDRNSLPTNFNSISTKDKIKQPTNKNEEILLNIFKKLLSFDDIGIDDDFFELGGDSLLAIKLQVEAISNNLQISYADIFEHPTAEDLAKCIEQSQNIFTEASLDYEKYNSILEKNMVTPDMEISNTPIGNVLLTGFTGFLGAHVLDSFMKKETGTIYCLIRGKNRMSPEERLKNVLHFYFDTKYDKYIGSKIKLVEGDITLPEFGLNVIDYNMLGTDVNTVIHCAALVKHYGSYKEFESINVIGTKRVVDFSKSFDLKLLHVSTISVSGNNLAEGSNINNYFEHDMLFNETNFYIGQNLKNFYVRSKFEAERIVLDAIFEGLQGCILRMGNLTSRFSEGKFQQNHFENAFVNTIKSFIQIGCIPDYLLNSYCEFTPIDFCGDAIINISNHISKNYTVFHLLNEKHVELDRLCHMLNEIGIDVNIATDEEFRNKIVTLLKDEKNRNNLDGIINNLDKNKKFMYKSDVIIDSSFTKEFLSKIGFEWPYIDTKYIKNYFKYLTDIGYFNLNIN